MEWMIDSLSDNEVFMTPLSIFSWNVATNVRFIQILLLTAAYPPFPNNTKIFDPYAAASL